MLVLRHAINPQSNLQDTTVTKALPSFCDHVARMFAISKNGMCVCMGAWVVDVRRAVRVLACWYLCMKPGSPLPSWRQLTSECVCRWFPFKKNPLCRRFAPNSNGSDFAHCNGADGGGSGDYKQRLSTWYVFMERSTR